MLTNWKYDALYLEGEAYDFGNLSDGIKAPPVRVLEDAIEAGYMELARNDDPIAEPNIVPPLVPDTVVTPPVSKGKQSKEPKET